MKIWVSDMAEKLDREAVGMAGLGQQPILEEDRGGLPRASGSGPAAAPYPEHLQEGVTGLDDRDVALRDDDPMMLVSTSRRIRHADPRGLVRARSHIAEPRATWRRPWA